MLILVPVKFYHVQELRLEILIMYVKKYHVQKFIRPEILTQKSVNYFLVY
jgi:hypothetical protein